MGCFDGQRIYNNGKGPSGLSPEALILRAFSVEFKHRNWLPSSLYMALKRVLFFRFLRHDSEVKSVLHSLNLWSLAYAASVGEVMKHTPTGFFLSPREGTPNSVQPLLYSSLLG